LCILTEATFSDSFLGTEVALTFLRAGYRVRGTGRTASQLERWQAAFPEFNESFDFTVVPDMVVAGSFDVAVQGVDYVIHSKLEHILALSIV
jgi:uncharacterized protein YbjT (DUF2867 family)